MLLGTLGGLVCSGSGTLGVLVRCTQGSQVYVLSCSHVIANCGQFPAGFDNLMESQRVVQQPVATPCDATAGRVGILQSGFSVFVPQSDGTTDSDVALALLDPDVAAGVSNIQVATGNAIQTYAQEDPASWQYGMTTELLGAINPRATGFVMRYSGDAPDYVTFPTFGTMRFTGMVQYSTTSKEGDSGAPVVDQQNRLLGIHVGGSTAGVAVFFPLGPWLRQKGLEVL